MSEGRTIGAEDEPLTFARFWRCALQVNPVGYQQAYRGQEHGMSRDDFLASLLKVCQEEGIHVVGLADHGCVGDVDAMRDYLRPHGIVVFPGFEVATTEKVHWVCLFPEDTTTEKLNRILGALRLLDPTDGVTPSELGGAALLEEVRKCGGLCYAAHVTNSSGLLKEKKAHLWQDDRLLAAQIPGPPNDLPPECKSIANNKNPDYRRDRPMALINARDISVPEDLRAPGATCFVKMTRPSLDALAMAFKDPASRIRLQHEVQDRNYSRIERITVDGGYLDGLDVRLSDHLNAVIGGRGTGKSTLLESLRYALGRDHKGTDARKQGEQVVKENLGKAHARVSVHVVSAVQNMNRYTIVRRYGEPPRVLDAQRHVSTLQPSDLLPGIEIYGQNEIFELAKDPAALVHVLDRFLPDRTEYQRQVEEIRKRLRDNAQQLLAQEEQSEELATSLAQLPKLQEQVEQFKALGVETKLQQLPLLEKERQLVPRVAEELGRVRNEVNRVAGVPLDSSLIGDEELEGLPHAKLLQCGQAIVERAAGSVREHLAAIERDLGGALDEWEPVRAEILTAQAAIEQKLERDFATLPDIGGKSGKEVGRAYQALLRQIEAIEPQRSRASGIDERLNKLRQERDDLLDKLSDIRSGRTRALEQATKRLSRKLSGKIRITVQAGANRNALKDFLCQLPGIGESSVSWIDEAEDLTVPSLVAAIEEGPAAFRGKEWGVTQGKAEAICRMAREKRLELDTVDLEDRVVLELNVAHQGENYRPLERLSTGQQCTAILHVLLLENVDPLIMDQPEDNLDNAFIAKRIVQELRQAKTERQFLFATHNANIPVFGDAEWIGVFSATEEQGYMPLEKQGAIDVHAIRDEVSTILEGGRDAFIQRKEKYGF
jgi:DNA repair ATPase RecN